MTIPKTARKGLGSIRTHMNRAVQGISAHTAYLKIGSIEMEKERRMVEKKALTARLKEIDARIQEMDAAKHRLLLLSGEKKFVNHNRSAHFFPQPGPGKGQGVTTAEIKISAETDCLENSKPMPSPAAKKVDPPVVETMIKKEKRSFSNSPAGLNFKY